MPRDLTPPQGAPKRDVSTIRARATMRESGSLVRADSSLASGILSPSARDMESLTVLLTVRTFVASFSFLYSARYFNVRIIC